MELFIEPQKKSYNQQLLTYNDYNIEVFVKREDVLHDEISGNKFRKLKYNLIEAKRLNKTKLLTFGGAYSNHIAAVAAAGKYFGLKTIGVIRGDELKDKYKENPTLRKAEQDGMSFYFATRSEYRNKASKEFLEKMIEQYGDCYILPEGGTNTLAVKGCEEILTDEDAKFDYVCCASGTGGTVAGIINSLKPHQTALAFSVLKGDFLKEEIKKYSKNNQWELINSYHFGGYAKITEELKNFIFSFEEKNMLTLDPIYTSKVFFGVYDLISKGYFRKKSKILVIHTGGLQGLQSKILEK